MNNSIQVNENQEWVTKLSVVSLLIGVVGFFTSLYALAIHLLLLKKPGSSSLCDINSTVNCSSVIGSSYGEFASIPLGAYGMSFFAIIIAAAVLPKIAKVSYKWLAFWEMLLGVIGLVFAIALFYISKFILNLICPTCSIIHVSILIYAIFKIKDYFKYRKGRYASQDDAFQRFVAVSICLAIPPIAAGLIAPIIITKYFTETVNVKVVSPSSPQNIEQKNTTQEIKETPKVHLTFNKTNFVGNGEDYRRGSDEAKVVVQMFSDFGCPHCKIATEDILKAQDAFGLKNILFVNRFFPMSNKCNPAIPSAGWYTFTCTLAEASRCAGRQGKFWEFKQWAYLGQDWSNATREEKFSDNGLKSEAKSLGLNVHEFFQCVSSHVELQKVKEDAQLASTFNIKGVPLIFINDVEYSGEHSVEAFLAAFQQAASQK